LTANAFEDDRQRALQAGCDAFLTKPISRAPFFAALEKSLPGGSRAYEPLSTQSMRAVSIKEQPVIQKDTAASQQRRADDAPLDMKMIKEIRALGQPGLLNRLIALYCADSVKKVDAVRAALATHDPKALYVAAHGLKSASANLGGRCVVAICKDLELSGKQGCMPESDDALERLDNERARLCEALQLLTTEQPA
jgi:HPt (histidine-containing phosphotransfer) domain-containing protein